MLKLMAKKIFTILRSFYFVSLNFCVSVSVTMSTTGDKILDSALSKVINDNKMNWV